MAEGDTPYRFENGQWEVWDKEGLVWVLASSEAAALLRGYTKVKDIGQGRLVFYAENGDTMTEEVLLYRIEQMDEADRVKNAPWWGPEITAAFGPYYREHPKFAQALNLAQDLKLPGTPGLPTAKVPEPTARMTFEEAMAFSEENPDWEPTVQGGWWTVKRVEPTVEPTAAPSEPSFNQQFDRLLLEGRYEEAQQLWDIREEITSQGGRMTRAQAAQFLTGDLFKAEEIPALLDALTGPRRVTEGPLGQPLAPEGQARPPVTAEQAIEAGRGKQWFDAQGNPIPTPPWAAPQSIQAAARPFPTLPFKALPGAQQAIDRNRNLLAESAQRASQGPFGMAAEEQAAMGFQGAFQTAAPPLAAPTQPFPTMVEEFDPNFATAMPEVQEVIRREFARQQAAQAPSALRNVFAGQTPNVEAARQRVAAQAQPQPTTADVLKLAQSGDLVGAQRLQQQLVGAGGAPPLRGISTPQGQAIQQAPQVFEPPFDISGLSPETQAAIRGGTASVFQSGPDVGGPGAGMQQFFQVQEVNGERKGVHNIFSGGAGFGAVEAPAPLKPLTFADALAQINERRLHRQMLRRPQGRTIFA